MTEYIKREAAIQAATFNTLEEPHPSEVALAEVIRRNLRRIPAADVVPRDKLVREIFAGVKIAIKEEALRDCNEFEKAQDPAMKNYFKTRQDAEIFLYMRVDSLEKEYIEGADEKETD